MGQSQTVTVYYLGMDRPEHLRAKPAPPGLAVTKVQPPDPEVNRRFYADVGRPWGWTDRLVWPMETWRRYVDREELETWVARMDGRRAGYFELERQPGGAVQIVYFGLLPEFVGQGLGGAVLTVAVRRAWATPGARRVWLHTCTKDHPSALPNYQRRGFRIERVERQRISL